MSAYTSSAFCRNSGSSTSRESDWTMTISLTGAGPRSRSSRRFLARADSKLLFSRNSVVRALSSRAPATRAEATIATNQRAMTANGLLALTRASISVKGTLLYYAQRMWGIWRVPPWYCDSVSPRNSGSCRLAR